MNRSNKLVVVCFVVLSLVISGCAPGKIFGPTITPLPTNTPVPTSTFTPASTSTPTMTPSPTFTPTPTVEPPSQLHKYFGNVRLTYYENFDEFAFELWDFQPCQTVIDGELEFACANGFLNRKNLFHAGEGVLIDFKHDKQSEVHWWGMNFVTGNYGQDDWKNFGIAQGDTGQYVAIQKGADFPFGFPPFSIKSDVWYRLAMAIDEKGKISILVWERDNANAQRLKIIRTLGDEWAGLEWFFRIQSAENVVIYLDNYYQFTFSEMK